MVSPSFLSVLVLHKVRQSHHVPCRFLNYKNLSVYMLNPKNLGVIVKTYEVTRTLHHCVLLRWRCEWCVFNEWIRYWCCSFVPGPTNTCFRVSCLVLLYLVIQLECADYVCLLINKPDTAISWNVWTIAEWKFCYIVFIQPLNCLNHIFCMKLGGKFWNIKVHFFAVTCLREFVLEYQSSLSLCSLS